MMAKDRPKKKTDEQLAGSSYIIQFYNNVNLLKSHYSNYINLLNELKYKYGDNTEKYPDETRQQIIQQTQFLKYYMHLTYIEYRAISQNLGQTNEEINQVYHKLQTDFILKIDRAEKFVILINEILVNKIIKNLLETSEEIIKNIYD